MTVQTVSVTALGGERGFLTLSAEGQRAPDWAVHSASLVTSLLVRMREPHLIATYCLPWRRHTKDISFSKYFMQLLVRVNDQGKQPQ